MVAAVLVDVGVVMVIEVDVVVADEVLEGTSIELVAVFLATSNEERRDDDDQQNEDSHQCSHQHCDEGAVARLC